MRRLVLFAMLGCVAAGCQQESQAPELRPLVATAGYYALLSAPSPQPDAPTDGKCKNCGGKGYLTDGNPNIRILCPVCKGAKTECVSGTCQPNTRR